MKKNVTWILRPFEKIAGWQSLGWGLTGIAVSTLLSYISKYHYHGLLHFSSLPNDAWWVFVIEHLAVWIVPALLFWLGGILFSKSRIRPIDVFGTVAFAQLPLLGMNLYELTPVMQRLTRYDVNRSVSEIMNDTRFLKDSLFSLVGIIFLVWALIWMFNALKVSCNLKGAKLGIWYVVAVLGGDAICRVIISSFY